MSYGAGQIVAIEQVIETLNLYVNEVIKGRDDVQSILNFNDVIVDNNILDTILADAKSRALVGAQNLVILLS